MSVNSIAGAGNGIPAAMVSSPPASQNWALAPKGAAEDAKLKKAAGEFEGLLLATLWKSMKESFGTADSSESDPAHGTLEDWGIEVMSRAVGQAGGLGISRLILQHLGSQTASADQNMIGGIQVLQQGRR